MRIPHDAVESLYETLGPVLLAYARSLLRDRGAAEDAVQQVFTRLLTTARTLPAEPRPYLFKAVRNTCLNRRRAERREHVPLDPSAAFVAPDGLHALVPDLEKALRELPEEQREVVMLRVWGELSIEEAAAVLEIPPNTVASRYRYALGKLRLFFGAYLGNVT